MKDDLMEDFLDMEFTAKTSEPYITWRQYFKQMCLGHLPLLEVKRPREDWYVLDEITHEQYPEGWIVSDLCFIDPMIETINGQPFCLIDDPTDEDWDNKETNWELAAATLKKVVSYLFNEKAAE